MPLLIELPNAGPKLRNNFSNQGFAESTFRKPDSLGDFNSNGFAINDQFPSTLDGDPVIRTFNNFTVNEGHIVTPINRCKGMYLFVNGDLTINGTLSMTARGANAPGKFIGIDPDREFIYFNEEDIFSQYKLPVIGKEGGLGRLGSPGLDGTNGACGAGGGGNGLGNAPTFGASGTSFSGGSGGGGATSSQWGIKVGYNPEPDGGAGGASKYVGGVNPGYGGGGAGNPGGTGNQNGQNGTGGLMLLFVKGNIIFGPNGKIVSKGMNGGDGKPGIENNTYNSGGGGASGGGAIHLFSKSTDIDISKIDVSGGLGGISTYTDIQGRITPINGHRGGKGSVQLYRL